ncbi:MAG: hypothetical protein JXR73_14930 [Candidatus Omnitrophica bacterium]|nr:hypothetical protein [Candidatus Omnitrophota bacterium]
MKIRSKNLSIARLSCSFFLLFLLMISAGHPSEAADDLAEGFIAPPDSARPWTYWFFMDGNWSREGITADLESMKEAGIGGVILMEVNVGIPRGPVEFMSEEWRQLFKHAVEEAERLGLEITLNAGPGWTGSGGPWVKVEQSMQYLEASATEIQGGKTFDAILPIPQPRKPYFGESGLPEEILEAREKFYADVAVLAFPKLRDAARISDIDEKALYVREPYTSKPGVKPFIPAPASHPDMQAEAIIKQSDIIDLTSQMKPDGRLTWDAPPGEWTVVRFGRRNTGANTRPAPLPGLGFECDKFDAAALEAHFDAFIGSLLRTIGPRPIDRSSGWTMLHIDSWEMGSQNWTAGFRDEFRKRRGYDLLPYLPVMTGRVVESLETSERFLWDLRQTAQELVLENHALHLKELGRAHGFGLSIEPYDMNPNSDMALGGAADVPMCEFWADGYGFNSTFSCIEAVSIAHTLGRPIVAAESFTSDSQEAWKLYPGAMKNQGDWALCNGINRIVFHRFAHQPWLNRRPGMTMGPYGVHWDRTQTWWPMVKAYHRYLSRCQFLLRQGTPVADICYLAPEGAPHVFRPPSSAFEGKLPDRRGYNFDGCAPEHFIRYAAVKDNCIVFPSGASYRLLALPSFETMTPALLEKIKQLVEDGAAAAGPPPRKSPGLSNYPQCDADVQAMAKELWGDVEKYAEMTRRKIGKGVILTGGELNGREPNNKSPRAIEQAQWIWHPEGNPEISAAPCTRYFHRTVTIDASKPIQSAYVEITADNEFELWINGQKTAQGSNFNVIYKTDVASLLRPGENLLAVSCVNGGDAPNPAGLIAALRVTFENEAPETYITDRQWLSARDEQNGWQNNITTANNWFAAVELGPARMSPWRLNTSQEESPELYPEYEATARILSEMNIPPDFEAGGPIRYIHRRSGDMEIYFVSNRTAERVEAPCRFRVQGKPPQLWNPVTGDIRSLPEFKRLDQTTEILLRFAPHQSYFVIFQSDSSLTIKTTENKKNFSNFSPIAEITGPWEVWFDEKSGGPGKVAFNELKDWRMSANKGIRYYSGIAAYETVFDFPAARAASKNRILLDLGSVYNLVHINLNGHDLGVLWCDPWQVDITHALKEKDNRLILKVANLWPNRLIGDLSVPQDQRISWTTWNPYKPADPLLPSGLLGPMRIMREE